jgi:membrane fusion protein, hemolysin D
VEIMRQQEDASNTAIVAQHQLDALRADRESFIQSWYGAISQELVTARNSRDAADAQLEKARKHKDLVRLVASDDSVVLSVTKLSVGSVLKSGDQIMTLTPLSTPMQAEIEISPRDIGFIRVGDPTMVKVDAFNYTQYGTAKGHVEWISDGAFTFNDDTGQPTNPYYKVRIAIDKMNFHNVPKTFRLIPGMTLEGDIKVGRRTIGSYIWDAVARTSNEAMREP